MSQAPTAARVLLAEDNLLNQQLMLDLLGGAGYQVEVATNGREAVTAVEQRKFDLVLMDIQMPEMDGLEATRRIRALPAHAKLPIIAMTANVMPEDRARCAEAGMNDFIPKPIDIDAALKTLTRWLAPAA